MSEIERYLDELFDRLAGQGAVGRRALLEAEDHLRAAAAAGVARGVPGGQAEHDAVIRFGSPAMVARKMRAVEGAGCLNRALSAGWLLAGLVAAGCGVAYLTAAGRLGWRSPLCADFLSPSCAPIGHVGPDTTSAAIAAATGAALLLGRWLAVRFAGLAPARRGFALTAGMVLAMAAVVIGAVGQPLPLPVGLVWQVNERWAGAWGNSRIVIAAGLIECLAAAVSLADSRRRRGLP